MPVAAQSRHPATWLARVVQTVGLLFLRATVRLCWRADVRWAGPRPAAPVLYVANHRSFLDPPLVGMWMRDPIAYFARSSLWKVPPIRIFLEIMRGIPVERENPGLSSMKGAIERLNQGLSVLVFPEGTRTRNGRIGRLRDGPALFARRAHVAVVPVYLHRSEDAWPRGWPLPCPGNGRIVVRFGRPLVPPANLPQREQDAWLSRRLDAWMRLVEARMYGEPVRRHRV